MEVPLPAEGTFDVVLGESFTGADQRRELVLLKYHRHAVESAQQGTLVWDEATNDAQLAWTSTEGTKKCSGRRAEMRSVECLLIFDPDTNSFTLERASQTFQFQNAYTAGPITISPTDDTERLSLPSSSRSHQTNTTHPADDEEPRDLAEDEILDELDIVDDFIEVNPTSRIHAIPPPRPRPTTQHSIYGPVIVPHMDDTAYSDDGYSSSTSSGTTGSSTSGTTSSGSSSSGSSSSGSDSDSDSDSSSDHDSETSQRRKTSTSTVDSTNNETSMDILEEEIAAAMEVDDKDDSDDNLDWLENELEEKLG